MEQLTLFDDIVVDAPETEGIKYAGSKLKLLPHILREIKKLNPTTVLDGFSGSTRVSQALAKRNYTVISNDISEWSRVFATCYLLNTKPSYYYEEIIDHLNNLPPVDGWFTENYGGDPSNDSSGFADGLKKPWQIHNTRKLDAIRGEVDRMNLGDTEKCVLITSLIHALDAVDSTMGHFSSYLNKWSPRSYNTLFLRPPSLISNQSNRHKVFKGDILKNITDVIESVDVAYFDPPYGSNNEKMPPSRVRYSAYYHVWTTICLNDKPKLFGKVKRREDSSDTIAASTFEEFRKNESGQFIAVESIGKLLKNVKANYIVLSYSSGGRATAQNLHDIIAECGELINVSEIDYKRNVMADMRWTNEWVRDSEIPNLEFIFSIKKK